MEVTLQLIGWLLVALLISPKDVSGDFAYGVNVPETGDVKAHLQTSTPDGRTEGEYRWLQPNGLYLVTRYFVDGNSGYQASVSEEPGETVDNFYINTHDGPSGTRHGPSGTHHGPSGSFFTSKINNNNVQSHNTNQLQNRPFSSLTNKIIPSGVTIVGENEQLISNTFTSPQRFKRQFNFGFVHPGANSQSFSRSSSSNFGSSSSSESGSRAKSAGFGGSSSSQSFSKSSSSSSGSRSSSQSFSSSGFPLFFHRNKRSPQNFGASSFSRASSGGFGGNSQAQSSSGSSFGRPGQGFGSNSFSQASSGGFGGNGFAQSSSKAFAGGRPGFGSPQGFGFGQGFGGFGGGPGFGEGPGFGSQSSSNAFSNGFGGQSFAQSFSSAGK